MCWTRHDSCSNDEIPILFSDDLSYMGDLHQEASLFINPTLVLRGKVGICLSWLDTWVPHV